jgi:hypothetical protein
MSIAPESVVHHSPVEVVFDPRAPGELVGIHSLFCKADFGVVKLVAAEAGAAERACGPARPFHVADHAPGGHPGLSLKDPAHLPGYFLLVPLPAGGIL